MCTDRPRAENVSTMRLRAQRALKRCGVNFSAQEAGACALTSWAQNMLWSCLISRRPSKNLPASVQVRSFLCSPASCASSNEGWHRSASMSVSWIGSVEQHAHRKTHATHADLTAPPVSARRQLRNCLQSESTGGADGVRVGDCGCSLESERHMLEFVVSDTHADLVVDTSVDVDRDVWT